MIINLLEVRITWVGVILLRFYLGFIICYFFI
jgi:hypothetical protein